MGYAQEKIKPYNESEDKKVQVEQMFDHIAPTYDTLNHTLSAGIDRYWRRKAIRRLREAQPQKVLDIATGTGDFALLIDRLLMPKEIVGIDLSEGMMKIAREKAKASKGTATFRFLKEDCAQLSFEEGSFDAATVAFGVRNFEELDKALKEVHRVLKQDGQFVILELSTPVHFPMKQLFACYSRWILPFIGRCISKDAAAYTYLPKSIEAFPQGEVMQGILQQAGFREVTFERLTGGICTMYIARK